MVWRCAEERSSPISSGRKRSDCCRVPRRASCEAGAIGWSTSRTRISTLDFREFNDETLGDEFDVAEMEGDDEFGVLHFGFRSKKPPSPVVKTRTVISFRLILHFLGIDARASFRHL